MAVAVGMVTTVGQTAQIDGQTAGAAGQSGGSGVLSVLSKQPSLLAFILGSAAAGHTITLASSIMHPYIAQHKQHCRRSLIGSCKLGMHLI